MRNHSTTVDRRSIGKADSPLKKNLNPPTAKLQLLLLTSQRPFYFDFGPDPDAPMGPKNELSMPYLYGLDYVLNYFQSSYSLFQLAILLDQTLPKIMEVTEGFDQFLKDNSGQISAHKVFQKTFFRGDQLLTKKETYRVTRFKTLIKFFNRNKKSTNYKKLVRKHLFPYKLDEGVDKPPALCNFDLGLYQNSIFIIDRNILKGHSFGLRDQHNNSFMAHSSQKFVDPRPLGQTTYIKGDARVRGASMCLFPEAKKQMVFWGSETLDPGQLIYHLLQYKIYEAKNTSEVDQLLKFGRYLFLVDPIRLYYESDRGSVRHLQKLLQIKIPIFHVTDLGKIWGYSRFKGERGHFILDGRHQGILSCQRDMKKKSTY